MTPPLSEIIPLITDEEACIGFLIDHQLVYSQPRCARCRNPLTEMVVCGSAQIASVTGKSQYSRIVHLVTYGYLRKRSCLLATYGWLNARPLYTTDDGLFIGHRHPFHQAAPTAGSR